MRIAFIVVAFGAAVALTLMFIFGEEDIPADQGSESQWLCAACDDAFKLTPKQEREARKAARTASLDWPPTVCVKCDEREAYRAKICSQCNKVYFGLGVPNSTGKCPRCFPDAEPPEPDFDEPDDDESGSDKPTTFNL